MVARDKLTSAEAFDAFIARPENADRLFELIHGEIVEKAPSNPYASEIAQLISFFIRRFLREQRIEGHVTEGQGGYRVAGEKLGSRCSLNLEAAAGSPGARRVQPQSAGVSR